jgi:isopentenyl diphosphate isomerase/L-lactate dehydrogenase-like FMN-dependent dehydrogenase
MSGDPVTISDFEEVARQRLPTTVYDYFAGGAGDEISLRRNCAAFDELLLAPRVLRDVSRLDPITAWPTRTASAGRRAAPAPPARRW